MEERTYTRTPYKATVKWPFKHLVSVLSPYNRKPGLFGLNVSILTKGVSKSVHNIAFLPSLSQPPLKCHYHPESPPMEERTYTRRPYKATIKWPFKLPLSVLSPYSRKPGLFGPNVSIFAKGVSKGVHNIAFLLSPDCFRPFDLYFFSAYGFWLDNVLRDC